jgi:SAM-dependent methyltransferase
LQDETGPFLRKLRISDGAAVPSNEPIRHQYERLGVQKYYEDHGSSYQNPHEHLIRRAIADLVPRWGLDLSNVLDLACGSGEATLALAEAGARTIQGIDPFTEAAYRRRTGRPIRSGTFEDIAAGSLKGETYTLIVCSYALHLAEESRLPFLCYQLKELTADLLILTPHKRPELSADWGWQLKDEKVFNTNKPEYHRLRARRYVARLSH